MAVSALRFLLTLSLLWAAQAFAPVLAPPRPQVPRVRPAAMQVQAPVKPPDIQLAPTEPKNDQASSHGKKFKLLLFNDNMNKCVRGGLERWDKCLGR